MTTINSVIITDEAIETIKELQEGDAKWLTESLENLIDFILDFGSQDDNPVQRLTMVTHIRILEQRLKSLSKLKE